MTEPSTIHGVGPGTIEKSLVGLLLQRQHTLEVDDITFQKHHPFLWDRVTTQRLVRQGAKPAVDSVKIPAFKNVQLQPTYTPQEALERTVVNCNTVNLAVLIITHDPTLKNHLETVCMTYGAQIVTALLSPEDKDFNPGVELSSFGLIVVDLEVLGDCERRQKRLGCRLLRNWTEIDPTLPLLFIGTVSQKRAILAIRADTVRFLTQPLNRHELARVIETCDRVKKRRPSPWRFSKDDIGREEIIGVDIPSDRHAHSSAHAQALPALPISV